MRFGIALLPLILVISGCAAGFANPTGLSSVAGALEAVGSTATGFKSTQSAAELNSANKDLVEQQTAMAHMQVEQTRDDHQRLAQERVVTARLLKGMSDSYHEPVFLTLADWVEAGGDPDFAFKYALAHIDEDARAKMMPQQTLSLPTPAQPAPRSALPPSQTAAIEAGNLKQQSASTSH